MPKFFGPIGFSIPTETRPGVWNDRIEERNYPGDVTRNSNRWVASSDSTNDDLTVNNQISIVADAFAENHFHTMKYVNWMGANWKVTSVEVKPPRLIINIGGVYNGPTASDE